MIVGALVFFALRLDLGVDVWWYFFLLLENGTIPASATSRAPCSSRPRACSRTRCTVRNRRGLESAAAARRPS